MAASARRSRLRALLVPSLRALGLRHVVIPPLRAYFRYFPIQAGKPLVWHYVAAHLWWLENPVRTTTRAGVVLDVDARDYCGRFIYYFGIWEPRLTDFLRSRLKPGDYFVDVGANVGYFSIAASRLIGPTGRVIAIEPIPRTLNVLSKNLARNGATNVRTVNLAVWDREERLSFFVSRDAVDGTSTTVPALAAQHGLDTKCEVDAAPIGAIVAPDERARVRVIKIDIEGGEIKAVAGLDALLQESRDDLEFVMEVTAPAFRPVVDYFRARGFHAYALINDYSPAAYVRPQPRTPLPRIDSLAEGETQIDLVFSRIDAAELAG